MDGAKEVISKIKSELAAVNEYISKLESMINQVDHAFALMREISNDGFDMEM